MLNHYPLPIAFRAIRFEPIFAYAHGERFQVLPLFNVPMLCSRFADDGLAC